jgi:hypothetical protein
MIAELTSLMQDNYGRECVRMRSARCGRRWS